MCLLSTSAKFGAFQLRQSLELFLTSSTSAKFGTFLTSSTSAKFRTLPKFSFPEFSFPEFSLPKLNFHNSLVTKFKIINVCKVGTFLTSSTSAKLELFLTSSNSAKFGTF